MTARLSKTLRATIVDAILKDTKQVNYKALLDADAGWPDGKKGDE